MEKQYAQALWKLVEGGMKPLEAVRALHENLKRAGREELLPRIGREFSRIAHRESKREDMVVSVAHEKDVHHAKSKAREVMAKLGIDEDVKTQVDDTLIGGWRLEGKGHLVDASYKKYLLDIYTAVTK